MLLAFRILWDWLWDRAAFRVLYEDGSVSDCMPLHEAKDRCKYYGRVLWDASRGG